jgi:competence ComEA-like helix-hairpin-helix protein
MATRNDPDSPFRYRPPLDRRPWWRRIGLAQALPIALALFTVGSAAIWFFRDAADLAGRFGPAEGSLIVNINTATADELETLPGIGTALAQLVIAGRPYATVDELTRVRGIGPATVDGLRPLLTTTGDTRPRE